MLHEKEESFLKMTELHKIKEKIRHQRICLEIAIISTR
jgi:hypothetical protein